MAKFAFRAKRTGGKCAVWAPLSLLCGALTASACSPTEPTETGDAESVQHSVTEAPSTGCGSTVEAGTYAIWPGGYQAWVNLTNLSGATATDFEVLLDLGNSTLRNGYLADYTPVERGQLASAPRWLRWQTIPQGKSYQFGFIANGTYATVTPYLLSINDTACDTLDPSVDLSASSGLFTRAGTLTLTASATDDVSVRKVVFEEDGRVIGEDWEAPYTLDLAVSRAENGRHHYTATALDPSGNNATARARVLVAIGNRFLGSAPDVAADYEDFTTYFDGLTPGNAGKWGAVEGVRDVMDWTKLDVAYDFAKTHGIPFKLHTLVWGQQQPSWVANLPPGEQLEELEEWMAQLAERYPDVAQIDVVNEPLHAAPSYREALGGAGATGWDWLITAFEMARRHFPRSELILNEYQVVILDSFTDEFLRLVAVLQERDLIDGIGEQGHFLERAEIPVVQHNLARLAATGLPIYISEFDLNFADDARHANRVRDLFTVFWDNPSVLGVTHWGHLQDHTWRADAYLVRSDRSRRPALDWLMCSVGGAGNCTVPEYFPEPWEGDEQSLTLQAEEYDDAKGVLALGNTVAYTDPGDWLSFTNVMFQPTWDTFRITYAKGNAEVGSVSVHLDTLESAPWLTVPLPSTGGWGTSSAVDLPWAPLKGTRKLYLRFNDVYGVANIDSIRFGTPANLVANGSFESGISGWFGWGGTLTASADRAHSGTGSLRVTHRGAGSGTAAYDLTASVARGRSYAVRLWLTIGGADQAPANVTAKIACAGSSDVYTWLANRSAVPNGTWVELAGTLRVPDCDLTQLLFYAEGPPAGVDLYVDDVSVVP